MGRPAIKLLGRGGGAKLVCGRPTLALSSVLVHQTKQLRTTKRKAKEAAGVEGQVATVLESHNRQIDTKDTIAIKRARQKEQKGGDETEVGTTSNEITGRL